MVSISCGGGGYGSPLERSPALVIDDVREGWISRSRAEMIYGVALSEDLAIDEAATARLRSGQTSRP
jgi:N-methylhydantoinase B